MICPGCGGRNLDGFGCQICKGVGTILEPTKLEVTSRIPDFLKSLDRMREVHIKKTQDYANPTNPFSNFDVSEYLISVFDRDRDKVFVWPIATKLARLATLLNSGDIPNNESIDDSFIDAANYILLWKADYVRRKS